MTGPGPLTILSASPEKKQQLTHQTIHARFLRIGPENDIRFPEDFRAVTAAGLDQLAFPKIIVDFLKG